LEFQAERIKLIKASPSMAISLQARKMRQEGADVIDLSLGEPDFDTPAHIVEAAYRAMCAGQTRYTAADGTPELKAAVARKFQRDNGLIFAPDEISVANGAKQSIFNGLFATLEPGDEVLIPAPFWVSYSDMVSLAGGVPRIVPCGIESDFLLTPESFEQHLTPRTRWVILNSPSNPSGAVYDRGQLGALGEVLLKHPRVLVLSDEIYEHITYGAVPFVSFGAACPALRGRTLIVNGVSKTYAMTGWRIGYAAGPKALMVAMGKIQSQSTSNPCSVAQAAAVEALNGPQDCVAPMVAEYRSRSTRVLEALSRIPGLRTAQPQGAFYAYPHCGSFIGTRAPDGQTISNDADLAAYLLRIGHVATVPGVAFGLSPYLRLSFATSQAVLDDAMERIQRALADLRQDAHM